VRGYRTGENPARWQGHLAEVLPGKAKIARAKHYAALPYAEASAFVAQLASHQGIGPRALEFLILTASRSNEVLGARWSEIDVAAKLWTIPAERMKEHEEHRVPLSARAIEILRDLPTEGDFVFVGSRPNSPPGKNTFLKLIKLMGHDVTGHGFRSTFRDWAGDRTNFPREITEAALAHKVGNAVEKAYRRGDALEKRRKLMEAWAAFVTAPLRDATITHIRRAV
jgi:integrase